MSSIFLPAFELLLSFRCDAPFIFLFATQHEKFKHPFRGRGQNKSGAKIAPDPIQYLQFFHYILE
jgi:hypothetical protein